MRKIIIVILALIPLLFLLSNNKEKLVVPQIDFHEREIQLPIYLHGSNPFATPNAQRGQEYVKWISPGCRIKTTDGYGSGTICYYDPEKNLAYVISCGHLFERGEISPQNASARNLSCELHFFYHNDIKLPNFKKYQAKVIFSSFLSGADFSLMTFEPDWQPNYFPIATLDKKIVTGQKLHSTGCDGAGEVAHYEVEVVGMQGKDLITKYNSPRSGRSGGGLITDDGYYVGICWGSSDAVNGNGIGLFTPLPVIYQGYSKNGYGFLLGAPPEANYLGRNIPIRDRIGLQGNYPKSYIPMPQR